ncbi:hypothetical protein F441_03890, partial [Phytophthora nicotianae CJ01A1]
MTPDSIVALPVSALQLSIDTTADKHHWARAEKADDRYQQQFPENAILYVLNNHRSPQWFYGYESGTTKAQREMKHVLVAYVFLLYPLPNQTSRSQNDCQPVPVPVAQVATCGLTSGAEQSSLQSVATLQDQETVDFRDQFQDGLNRTESYGRSLLSKATASRIINDTESEAAKEEGAQQRSGRQMPVTLPNGRITAARGSHHDNWPSGRTA